MATNRQNENESYGKKGPIFCEACQYDDSFEEATGFCVACSEYLCQTCCRDHKRNKVTREHSLLKNNDIPADISPFKTIKQLSTCDIHPDNDIAYECGDHETLVCVFCLTESHRKCENIHDLGVVDSVDSDINIMAELQDRMHALKAQKEEQRNTIVIAQEKNKIDVQCLVAKWKDHITRLGNDLKAQLTEMSLSETMQLKEFIDDCHEIEIEIQRNKTLIETLMIHGTKRQIAVVLRRTNDSRANLKEKLHTLKCQRQRNIALINVKQLDLLTSIAELSSEEKENNNSDILEHTSDEVNDNVDLKNKPTVKIDKSIQTNSSYSTSDGKQRSSRPFLERETGQIISLFKIKTETDTSTCSILGVKLSQHGILLADFGNRKLKLFSRIFDLMCEQSLPGQPVDMSFDGEYAYVCYSDLKKVTKHPIYDSSIGVPIGFQTRLQPISLTVFDSRLMILFATKESFDSTTVDDVHIEIRRGNAIAATISYNTDNERFKHVRAAKQVSVFDGLSIVFSENTRVTCYTVDSQESKLQDREWFNESNKENVLKKAKGFAKDSEGNMYICGEDSNNVHLISTKYKVNRLVVHNINRPMCVALDEQKDRLIIGCRADNYLHVFSFK
ncbi:uncharacterized protein LOC128235707 [Mya arenaria]|uniref:uncharacterized protein LOC128235707 n=1 Tax=Mya arenaria TaxID=6604 RepID=UPI0022E55E80|nr:uncharacterized protein LOC128235707 [Mya arenaria]